MANVGVDGSVMTGSEPRVPMVRKPWKSSEIATEDSSSKSSASTLAASRLANDFRRWLSLCALPKDLVPKFDFG